MPVGSLPHANAFTARPARSAEPDAPVWRAIALIGLCAGLSTAWAATLFLQAGDLAALPMAILVALATFLPIMGLLQCIVGAVAKPLPALADVDRLSPATPATLIVMPVRDEPVEMLDHALTHLARDLSTDRDRFEICLASDSDDPAVVAAEQRLADKLDAWVPTSHVRRAERADKKAGNLRHALATRGGGFDFCVVLDADSVMRGPSVRALAEELAAQPGTALIQSLVKLAPHRGRLGRRLAFGLDLAYRVQTTGLVWWRGVFGPFWGHNAIFRIERYLNDAALPRLSGHAPWGGTVMSHDMAEVALLASKGHACRFVTVAHSYEGCPTTLQDFLDREKRWALGNLQYAKLLAEHGERFAWRAKLNLFLAIVFYVAPFAWLGLIATGAVMVASGGLDGAAIGGWAVTGIMGGLIIANGPRLIGAATCERGPGFLTRLLNDVWFSLALAPIAATAVAGRFIGMALGATREAWGAHGRGGATAAAADSPWARRRGQLALGLALAACAALGPPLAWLFVAPVAPP
ncbi:MAG: glycosyltransferase family 2 protein, partial [Paracoccaceae bacterium]